MNGDAVVLVHGIWMPAVEMMLLGRRLQRDHGFDAQLFGYPSVAGTLDDNADRLSRYLGERGFDRVHLVGHSLGGVVVLRMLARHDDAPPGRVVCLGSPLVGSRAAAVLDRYAWGRRLSGNTLKAGVVDAPPGEWAQAVAARREIGVIAGTLRLGFGMLLTSFEGAHDGAVSVAETRLPGARDHLCLRVNHTGMAISREVAEQTAAFLKRGRFLRRHEQA